MNSEAETKDAPERPLHEIFKECALEVLEASAELAIVVAAIAGSLGFWYLALTNADVILLSLDFGFFGYITIAIVSAMLAGWSLCVVDKTKRFHTPMLMVFQIAMACCCISLFGTLLATGLCCDPRPFLPT